MPLRSNYKNRKRSKFLKTSWPCSLLTHRISSTNKSNRKKQKRKVKRVEWIQKCCKHFLLIVKRFKNSNKRIKIKKLPNPIAWKAIRSRTPVLFNTAISAISKSTSDPNGFHPETPNAMMALRKTPIPQTSNPSASLWSPRKHQREA